MSGPDRGAVSQSNGRGIWCRRLFRGVAAVVCFGLALPAVAGAATFTVTTAADGGPGSLREAIMSSNDQATAGGNVIDFDIAAPAGPIAPLSDLPAITEPVLIDGLTQPGARANQDPEGFDAVLPIRLIGAAGTGLRTGAGSSSGTVTIRGVRVEGFTTGIASDSPDLGLEVLGSHVSGSPGDRVGRVGIVLRRSDQFDRIGGFASADTTLVTDAGTGVRVAQGFDPGASGEPQVSYSRVRSNDVGVELATVGTVFGTAIVENRLGVDIRAAGVTVYGDNVVANNVSDGIAVSAGPGGSLIGDEGYGNVIVDNGGAGVAILSGAGTAVLANQIDGNGKLGIDLRGDGLTPNDPFDADDLDALGQVLPNRLQNAPEIVDAVTTAGVTTITARFHGRSNTAGWGELFRSPSCDPSGHGEGAEPLGGVSFTTDAAGNMSGSQALPFPSLPDGTVLTATVTTDDGTSEFSPCTRTHAAPTPAAGTALVAPGPARLADDATAPRITRLKLAPSRFAVGSKSTPIGLSRVRRGSSIRFTLSEAAQVELRFGRLVVGRRVGGKCKRTTRANRTRKRCRRGLRAGTLNRAGVEGPNRIAFSGRIGRRALKRGSYRLTARAVDAAGNAAAPRTIRFNVVKRRARN